MLGHSIPTTTEETTYKQCFKCGQTLPLSAFYRHPRMRDGHLGKCKECTKRDVRTHRATHPHVRAYDRERGKREHRRAKKREYELRRQSDPIYRKMVNAEQKVRRALLAGQLQRQPCEQCGTEYAEAHHDDYNRPLDVRWLCPLCHRRWHARNKPVY